MRRNKSKKSRERKRYETENISTAFSTIYPNVNDVSKRFDIKETYVSLILNHTNYLEPFGEDIAAARNEIALVSPYLHKGRVTQMLKLLDAPIGHGVRLVVITNGEETFKPAAWTKIEPLHHLLECNGILVRCQQDVYQKFAVLDEYIV